MEQLTFVEFPENPPPSKDLDEQYTPGWYWSPLNDEFQFTLDPCTVPEALRCPRGFTKAENGLTKSWKGERVWLNCPYSNISAWLHKARIEMQSGCQLVVALLPAWTDRRWWHRFVEPYRKKNAVELRFHKGRIVFGCEGNPEGVGRSGGKFPSVLAIWRAPGLVIPDPRQHALPFGTRL